MYISEVEPAYSELLPITDKVSRVVAPNPGHLTYHGTNTYFVKTDSGLAMIDPGPNLAEHIESLLKLCEGKLEYIFLTHYHDDHAGAVEAIRAKTGAQLVAAENSLYRGGKIDIRIGDQETLAGITAIATPGHTHDHLCFGFERLIFSGDHVMGWAPTAILVPEGNAASYMNSLIKIKGLRARYLLPAHGPKVGNIKRYVSFLIEKAEEKERHLFDTLADSPRNLEDLISDAYGKLSQEIQHVASRGAQAILTKFELEGKVICEGQVWRILQ